MRIGLRRLIAVLIPLTLLGPASVAAPAHADPAPCADAEPGVQPYSVSVAGETATGRVAFPDETPDTLVVFAHGYGHTAFSWDVHATRVANELGAAAVTMNYRGLTVLPPSTSGGLPRSRGWNAKAGAADLVAAARDLVAICPGIGRVVIMGVSMGGNMSGLAVAAKAVRPDNGLPLFNVWFDIEGAVNVAETYAVARLAAPANATAANAKTDLEAEAGGPIEQVPAAYADLVVVTRAADMAAGGLAGAVVVHGVDDGLVPINQSREMVAALAAAGIATDDYVVGRRSARSEADTTISGNLGNAVQPGYVSPLAGHSSEKSTTNIVMVTAMNRLAALLQGGPAPAGRHFVVDAEAGDPGAAQGELGL